MCIRDRRKVRAFLERGGVKCGLVGPKRATCGRCKAAATCIKPESFETTALAIDRMSTACARVVFPVRSNMRFFCVLIAIIRRAIKESLALPNKWMIKPSLISWLASLA